MNNKKKVLSFVCLGLVLVSVIMVSAGWKDLFTFGDDSDLEGELPESAQANVKIEDTSLPYVVFVNNVTDGKVSSDENHVLPNERNIDSGEVEVSFWFLAEQAGQLGNLNPVSSTSATVEFVRTGSSTRIGSCSPVGEVDDSHPAVDISAANYTCNVIMKYYDDPASDWTINLSVTDTKGQIGYNDTKTFVVDSIPAASTETNYLNWTETSLTMSSTNDYADNEMIVDNDGNVDFDNTKVNATTLNGTDFPNQYIPADKFVADVDGSSCDGDVLSDGSDVSVSEFTVPKATSDAGNNELLYFCVSDLSGLSLTSQDYTTEGGQPWVVTFE